MSFKDNLDIKTDDFVCETARGNVMNVHSQINKVMMTIKQQDLLVIYQSYVNPDDFLSCDGKTSKDDWRWIQINEHLINIQHFH